MGSVRLTRTNDNAPADDGSQKIASAAFTWASHNRLASGSDNFPVTWGADGHQYTSWGDGGGFGGDNETGRVSLGFGRVEGAKGSQTGVNINGGVNPTSGRSDWPNNTGAGSGKSYGILSLNGVLYAWITPGSNTEGYEFASLWKSTDDAANWTETSVKIEGTDAPTFNLVQPSILQMGQDYGENSDGYVYSYWIGLKQAGSLQFQEPGEVYLCRVPTADIETEASYEWYTGAGPTWGAIADRAPILEDTAVAWCMSGVTYLPTLARYVMVTWYGETNPSTAVTSNNLRLWEAPNPWGSWTKIHDETAFGSGTLTDATLFCGYVSPKWLSNGDTEFVLVFSGTDSNDSWNTVEGTFTLV